MIEQLQDQQLKLKRIFIESQLPEGLLPLRDLASNIWWSWDMEAQELFRAIAGEEEWKNLNYNPILLLDTLSYEQTQALLADKNFMKKLNDTTTRFQAYLKEKPNPNAPQIAYFCMEYGLHISIRLYSGGLGVLAGDFLKEASDMNVNMIAVGLLYRYGYFQQTLSLHGDQINNYPPQQFTKLPIRPVRNAQDEWLKVSIEYPGRTVFAKVWELKVGRMSLYLLDTDFDENSWEDRSLTHQLYGGDNEHRLKQEILLGIGGVRALNAMGFDPDIFHMNEGHAAFSAAERLKNYLAAGLTFPEATEVIRSSSLFTTHTPVPAGHDHFNEGLLRAYLNTYVTEMGLTWQQFVALGRVEADNAQEDFSMSNLAMRLSQEVNGVSKLHGTVSQKMFSVLYPGYNWEENHVGYVTNSVHYPTWISSEFDALYRKQFGKGFLKDQSNKSYWKKIHDVPAETIMEVRRTLKNRLLKYVRKTLQDDLTRRGENPRAIFEVLNNIDNDALIIGFARRFATYKRAHLLFNNLERLTEIVSNEERPIMFLFAGKAHPADSGGQDLIRRIIHISKSPQFAGKVIFLEDYNMEMAKLLVQGVDIWLNTPTRPKEASGTSGMKAALNGVMNFSVLDGWWAEGYRENAGWALPLERTYDNQDLQNELDAETIYNILENEILPTYYAKNEQGISEKWVSYIKNIIADVAPEFTMKRMMDDYFDRFYNKLAKDSRQMRQSNFAAAKELVAWKEKMRAHWRNIQVVNIDMIDTDNHSLALGEPFKATVTLDLDGISAEDVGVEVVFFKRRTEEEVELKLSEPLHLTSKTGNVATYSCSLPVSISGVYEYGFRLFPKHELLAHRQDLNLVKWL